MSQDTPSSIPALYPLGHFYSPLVDPAEIRKREKQIFTVPGPELPGIELRAEHQRQLFRELSGYYHELPFPVDRENSCRYWYDNSRYSYTDAIILYSFLRHLKPRRVVEVGSGFSSCVMLDTNERFFNDKMQLTFIEPFPRRLLSLVRKEEVSQLNIHASELQDVDLELFKELGAGDILFVDSTHVGKTGSDVNRFFFEIFPALQPGVLIHIHDIFYPFEYPAEWVYEGRGWNECYMLRAFLAYNDSFQIEFFSHYFYLFHRDLMEELMPLCLKNPGGNIWLRKTR